MSGGQVFQTDHPLVKRQYESPNHRIEQGAPPEDGRRVCAIYFSSNNIYYPNTERAFSSRILAKNFFEWFRTRVPYAQKHIFLRDIHKQWYLTGIDRNIDSPDRLLQFLKQETDGFEIVTVGSSAGGYAAMLYGILLQARKAISFNGQIEISSLTRTTNPTENPLLFRFLGTPLERFYDLRNFLPQVGSTRLFQLYSAASEWDAQQASLVANTPIELIPFGTSHHGIPFLKCAIPRTLEMQESDLESLRRRRQSPLIYSVRRAGVPAVVSEMARILLDRAKSKLFADRGPGPSTGTDFEQPRGTA